MFSIMMESEIKGRANNVKVLGRKLVLDTDTVSCLTSCNWSASAVQSGCEDGTENQSLLKAGKMNDGFRNGI